MTAYQQAGITADPRTWARPAPLLPALAAALRAAKTQAATALADRLVPFTEGTHSGAVRRADHHPPRGAPGRLLAARRARRAAPGRDPARPGRHLAGGLRPRPAPAAADHRRRGVAADARPRGREVPVPDGQVRPQGVGRAGRGHPGRRRRAGHRPGPGRHRQRRHPDPAPPGPPGHRARSPPSSGCRPGSGSCCCRPAGARACSPPGRPPGCRSRPWPHPPSTSCAPATRPRSPACRPASPATPPAWPRPGDAAAGGRGGPAAMTARILAARPGRPPLAAGRPGRPVPDQPRRLHRAPGPAAARRPGQHYGPVAGPLLAVAVAAVIAGRALAAPPPARRLRRRRPAGHGPGPAAGRPGRARRRCGGT